MPELPYSLAPQDTLSFPVYCDFIVLREIIYDTMYVETPDKTYKELMMINGDLIESVKNNEKLKVITVYPNPTSDKITFTWNKADTFTLDVYSLNGSLIYNEKGFSKQAVWIPKQNKPGLYIYRLTTGMQTFTGKIIYK